jgi:hypothetical protein
VTKFNVPKREYCGGPKKMVSMRLPVDLMKEIEKISQDKGWTTTDLVCTVLDQFIQWEKKKET